MCSDPEVTDGERRLRPAWREARSVGGAFDDALDAHVGDPALGGDVAQGGTGSVGFAYGSVSLAGGHVRVVGGVVASCRRWVWTLTTKAQR